MMDSDMEGFGVPSPAPNHQGGAAAAQGGDLYPMAASDAQHGIGRGVGGGSGLMSPPPRPAAYPPQQQQQQGDDPALNHQLSADGSCVQPAPAAVPNAGPAPPGMDATLSGTTPFSNVYFANAAANGLHLSQTSTMTKAQVTQVGTNLVWVDVLVE